MLYVVGIIKFKMVAAIINIIRKKEQLCFRVALPYKLNCIFVVFFRAYTKIGCIDRVQIVSATYMYSNATRGILYIPKPYRIYLLTNVVAKW